jgi:hypothetical protein
MIKRHKPVILPVVLYGCGTWSGTLREEHRLRVSKNRLLIFGPKREEDGLWRKLHIDDLHSLYSSPNIVKVIKSRKLRGAGHITHMGEGRGVYRVLVGRPKGKRPVGRPSVGGRITLSCTLGREGSMGQTRFGRLRIGSDGGLL